MCDRSSDPSQHDLPPDFWARLIASKEPGEHRHALPNGAQVYCTRIGQDEADYVALIGRWTAEWVNARG